MKQMGKWLVTAVLALLMMIPAVLAEETASFMTLTIPTTAQEIDLGQNVVTDYDALCRFLDELPDVRKVDMFATKISRKDIPPKGKIVFWEYLKIPGRCWQYELRSFFLILTSGRNSPGYCG